VIEEYERRLDNIPQVDTKVEKEIRKYEELVEDQGSFRDKFRKGN